MAKGFGTQVFYIKETKRQDMFGTGRYVLLCVFAHDVLLEVKSAATAADVSVDTLNAWMAGSGFTFLCGQHGADELTCLTVEAYVEFCMYLAKTADNPYAMQLVNRAVSYGMGKAIDQARAEGLDYVLMPDGTKVRMNKDGHLLMEDVAASMGVSPDEMKDKLESEEFQAFSRNRWE